MKRVSIPIFDGNKPTYEGWKAAFTACIDQAPATPEYKLLQLRQHLTGEALKHLRIWDIQLEPMKHLKIDWKENLVDHAED